LIEEFKNGRGESRRKEKGKRKVARNRRRERTAAYLEEQTNNGVG
jgi:hypothetical protein